MKMSNSAMIYKNFLILVL